ncbi:TPA: hypothetical protein ACGOBK_001370 [Streptococcus agalactiae]|nr:hypothetical protein [Streptococcus agalactiae]
MKVNTNSFAVRESVITDTIEGYTTLTVSTNLPKFPFVFSFSK